MLRKGPVKNEDLLPSYVNNAYKLSRMPVTACKAGGIIIGILREQQRRQTEQSIEQGNSAGATYNLRDGDMAGKDVWAVSQVRKDFKTLGYELHRRPSAREIKVIILEYKDKLADTMIEGHLVKGNIGVWQENEEYGQGKHRLTGRWFVEVTDTFENHDLARKIAHERKQQSIFGLKDFVSEKVLGGGSIQSYGKLVPAEKVVQELVNQTPQVYVTFRYPGR